MFRLAWLLFLATEDIISLQVVAIFFLDLDYCCFEMTHIFSNKTFLLYFLWMILPFLFFCQVFSFFSYLKFGSSLFLLKSSLAHKVLQLPLPTTYIDSVCFLTLPVNRRKKMCTWWTNIFGRCIAANYHALPIVETYWVVTVCRKWCSMSCWVDKI